VRLWFLRESLESVEIVSESDVREVMAAPPYDDSSPLVDKTKPRCVKFLFCLKLMALYRFLVFLVWLIFMR